PRHHASLALSPVAARRILPKEALPVPQDDRHRRPHGEQFHAACWAEGSRVVRCLLPVQASDGGLRKTRFFLVFRRFPPPLADTRKRTAHNLRHRSWPDPASPATRAPA